MKSAFKSAFAAFAMTAALLQLNLLPDAWGPAAPEPGSFEARHVND